MWCNLSWVAGYKINGVWLDTVKSELNSPFKGVVCPEDTNTGKLAFIYIPNSARGSLSVSESICLCLSNSPGLAVILQNGTDTTKRLASRE